MSSSRGSSPFPAGPRTQYPHFRAAYIHFEARPLVTSSSPKACPACGAAATGKFCSSCGATLSLRNCGQCGRPVAGGAQFCRECGAAVGAGPTIPARAAGGDRGGRTGWIAAAGLGVALLGVVIAFLANNERRAAAPAGPLAAPLASGAPTTEGPAGTPPDISNMSPKERYNRLYNRVMRAAESGDQATVTQFTPMTVMAYQQLDSIDTDARFHMAMLLLHTGQVPGAQAEADSILKFAPGHLFGYMIRGAAARWNKDAAALKKAQSDFLVRYDTEMKAKRPEYGEHERAVSDFRASALGQAPAVPPSGS